MATHENRGIWGSTWQGAATRAFSERPSPGSPAFSHSSLWWIVIWSSKTTEHLPANGAPPPFASASSGFEQAQTKPQRQMQLGLSSFCSDSINLTEREASSSRRFPKSGIANGAGAPFAAVTSRSWKSRSRSTNEKRAGLPADPAGAARSAARVARLLRADLQTQDPKTSGGTAEVARSGARVAEASSSLWNHLSNLQGPRPAKLARVASLHTS